MTRINLIDPSELHYKHLVAEYGEITRVFTLVRNASSKGKNRWNIGAPDEYVLGSGHVKFFYPRLKFILNRYHELTKEMINRGYNPNPIPYSELISGIPKHWFGDYVPTDDAIMLNRQRISDRLPKA